MSTFNVKRNKIMRRDSVWDNDNATLLARTVALKVDGASVRTVQVDSVHSVQESGSDERRQTWPSVMQCPARDTSLGNQLHNKPV